MVGRIGSIRTALLAGSMLALAAPAVAAEVTPERLAQSDRSRRTG